MILLILGCGRSGTHLLADVLRGPDTEVYAEDPRWFPLALAAVRNEVKQSKYLPKIADYYAREDERLIYQKKTFVDKTHVAALFYERLQSFLWPRVVKNIWIERDPLAAIASMKMHLGMRCDLQYARCFSVPNRFLGIYGEEWFGLSNVQRFAHKWLSYRQRYEELQRSRLINLFVRYEDLVKYPEPTIRTIEKKFGIRCSRPEMKLDSLTKWAGILTQEEVGEIKEIV